MMTALLILLAVLLIASVAVPRVNAGCLALLLTLMLAPQSLHMTSADAALKLFPTHLFLTLLGVTFFFTALNSNGLLDTLLQKIIVRFEKKPRAIPLLLFVLVALITAAGMGNIAAIALIAPLALPLSDKLGFSKTLMSILIVGAANAASFSPLTLPGIFIHQFVLKSSVLSKAINPDLLQWIIFGSVFLAISAATAVGFFILGGFRWWETHKHLAPLLSERPVALDFNSMQRKSALVGLFIVILFLISSFLNATSLTSTLPEFWRWIPKRFSEVGLLGWLGGLLLIVFKASDLEESIQKVPWTTILLVCGMSTYIEFVDQLGFSAQVSAPLQQNIPIAALALMFAVLAALVSAFASSVGVALPLFIPLIEAVSPTMSAPLINALIVSVCVGSHLVDASPLSTLGALCLAQVPDTKERTQLYRNLLLWGFAMIPVAGLLGLLIQFLMQ
jgi:di/tricarboxylate transporter